MLRVDPQDIIKKHLDEWSFAAISEASQLAVGLGHNEVTVEHLLIEMLKQPGGDLARICSYFKLDKNEFINSVEATLQSFRQGADTLPVFSPLLAELLQDAWLYLSTNSTEEKIRTGILFLSIALDRYRFCHHSYLAIFENVSTERLKADFEHIVKGSMENDGITYDGQNSSSSINEDSFLEKYGKNVTRLAKEGRVDPVFCRDTEINAAIDILMRRRKNNPIIVGEAGVGKTALVEGLALKIIQGDVPKFLENHHIYELDMGAMQAGASVQGEFEKRLKTVIDEVKNSIEPIILFIDEAHTLIGAGASAGAGDAANLLKPALARGELRTIAATTWSEYKKYFEKDPALTRRFQVIKLDEPTEKDAISIIEGLLPIYEETHGVYISTDAVKSAVELSSRYISGRLLPDKAVDLLDTAAARVSASINVKPHIIDSLEKKKQLLERKYNAIDRDLSVGKTSKEDLNKQKEITSDIADINLKITTLEERWQKEQNLIDKFLNLRKVILEETNSIAEKENANTIDNDNEDDIEALANSIDIENNKKDLQEVLEELNSVRKEIDELQGEDPLISFEVGSNEVAKVVADWTGILASDMKAAEKEKLLNLAKTLQESIIGQNHAIEAIANRIMIGRAGLKKDNAPHGVFLLAGPSGVGKTETAVKLAEELFASSQFLISVNMSEYQEKHTVSKLIGSPPGYVGFGEGGMLTEAIRKHPYSVVLLDEVEKANPEVLNLFYQVFDKGILTDGEGRDIDCKNCIFILTSNLGSEVLLDIPEEEIYDEEKLEQVITPNLANHFKPALLARMHIIAYRALSKKAMTKIIDLKLNLLNKKINNSYKVNMVISDIAKSALRRLCNRQENGARMVDHIIEKQLLPNVAQTLLNMEKDIDEDKTKILFIGLDDNADFRFKIVNEGDLWQEEKAELDRVKMWEDEQKVAQHAAQKAVENTLSNGDTKN